jgi:hypothetical protein
MRMSLFFVISGKRLVKGSKIDNKHKPNYDKYGLFRTKKELSQPRQPF